MSDSRFKVYDRVLSVILVLFIIAGVVPVSANAGTDDPEELHNYTFTVKDSNGEGVKGAVITYTAFFNQEIYVQNKTAETDGTGKVVLKELSGLNEEKLENSKLVIHYSVKADGYSEIEDAVSDITNAYENIDVIIHKIEAEKISVNLTKSGNGTVSLNEESLNNTLEMPKDQNKELTIQFRADEKYYIKTLSVNGAEKISTNDFPTEYSLKTTAEKDIDISVVFAETYTVRIQHNTESGKITLGSSEHNNVSEYTETFTEAKTEKFSYQAADGYKISLVKINDEEQELKDGSEFSTELAVNQDIDIELKVVKIYKVNVKLDPAKAVLETDPELETVTSEGGSVTVESGSNFGIKVIPAEGFRISEFKINDTEPKIDYSQLANGEEYSTNLKVTKDTDIVVTFVRIEYDITAQESSNGNVEIESSKVEYGDTAKFTISADDGYTIDQVTVNDTDVSGLVKPVADADSAVYTLTLENVVENKKIAVSFKENEPVSDFTWNRDDALRVSKDQTTYLFAGNADVTFSSIYNSDSIVVHTGSGENMKRYPEQGKYTYVTFNKDTKPDAPVTGIYVGKLHTLNGVQYYSYHKAAADSASINYYFLFDDDAPTITSEVKGTNMNDIYTSDISVKLTVADTDSEGLKSGIGTIRYTLSKDGKTDKEETIYSYTADDSISETVEKEIVISAKDYNSDEVVLKVEATDRAGNPAEVYEATFNINSTHPVIEVSADDSIDPSAEEGYYKKSRTIQLVYHDRDSSFDQDAAFGGIKIAAADKNGEQV